MKYSLDVHYPHYLMHNCWEEVGTEVAIVFSYINLNSFIGLINEIENIRFPGKT